MDSDTRVSEIKLQAGRTATVISRVDVLIDRLDEFQATGHEVPAQQALALLAGLSEEETTDLESAPPTAASGQSLTRCVDLPVKSVADEHHQTATTYIRPPAARYIPPPPKPT